MSGPEAKSGLRVIQDNLRSLPRNVMNSISRQGLVPDSRRSRSMSVFNNVFMHIHPVRTHRWSLRPLFTMGLGVASMASFIILAVSGIMLMVHYEPSVSGAYASVKNITYSVYGGRMLRNAHRWAAYVMVVSVFLHMVRVFYTNSYKAPREFNWCVGVVLFILTLALAFTGYCLPWDQLAYWAITIGSNIAASPVELTDAAGITDLFDIGAMQKELMLGSKSVGGPALLRFYWGHCIFLPLIMSMFLAAHMWRVRKDGGLSRPSDIKPEELDGTPSDELAEEAFADSVKTYGLMCLVGDKKPAVDKGPEHTVMSWPHLFRSEMAVFGVVLALLLVLAFFINAPLKELANPSVPENPAKAPWYFLAMQEIISYSAFSGGMLMPGVTVLFLLFIPYFDREHGEPGRWFSGGKGIKATACVTAVASAIAVVGMLTFTVRCGWLRTWFPDINQLWITLVNPGTVLAAVFAAASLVVTLVSGSTRRGTVVLFTYFLVSFIILTYFASVHRGPNWDFYWWPSMWPTH
jgi:quinol-cytochrome oxidoreductase complex cytochrome b subunit